jgi:hypothetical protein
VSDIDRYLDELFDRLAGQGAAGRRMLAEAEDHLRMTAAAQVEAGVPAELAEREAVARFGGSGQLAGQLGTVHQGRRLAAAAAGVSLLAGRAVLMVAGCYLLSALALVVWGTSVSIMRHTAAAGGLMLLAGAGILLVRRLAGWVGPSGSRFGLLGAAVAALAGVVVFVDLPLAAGLALGASGLWRHAAALQTGLALANCLAIGVARLARRTRATEAQLA